MKIKKRSLNISDIRTQKRNKKLCMVFSVLLIVCILVSSSLSAVSAASTVWGLSINLVDMNYFYSTGYGGSYCPSWSVIRQRCFLNAKKLASTFNTYAGYSSESLIRKLDYCYTHGYATEAASLGTKWNTLYYYVHDAVEDTSQIVGSGENLPVVNREEVTTDQLQNLCDNIQRYYDELQSFADDVNSLYMLSQTDIGKDINDSFKSSGNIVDYLWKQIGRTIAVFGTGTGTSDLLGISITASSIQAVAYSVSAIVKTFAYALACVLFGINITTTALQYEILTLRGGVRVFARVILVKIWIDLAIPICIYALRIVNSLAVQILSVMSFGNEGIFGNNFIVSTVSNTTMFDRTLGAILKILNLLTTLVFAFPNIIIMLVLGFFTISVMVKLVARGFELTCLTAVSPMFFAALAGEGSKRYFIKFISAFLSTAGYIVFITIVYSMGTRWISEATTFRINDITDIGTALTSMLPRAIICFACCRVMTKPPKVLVNLVEGV